MRRFVPATRRLLVLLLALAVSVLGMVVPYASSAEAASGDSVSYAYDDAGRLVGATDPVGDTAKYNYDAVGNTASIARYASSTVSILAFSPPRGPAGTEVAINGTGFSATASDNTVKFNGVAAAVSSATTTRLVAGVPSGATTGSISVTSGAGSATSSTSFTVAPTTATTITSVSPPSGPSGTSVTIDGTNFDPNPVNNVVSINATRVEVGTATPTSLGVSVPAATGSGRLVVRTPWGKATSSDDFLIPPPPLLPADVQVFTRVAMNASTQVSLTTANKVGVVLFDGTAGKQASVSFSANTINCLRASVFDPRGTLLASGGCWTGATAFLDQFSLPIDGTYTVLVDPQGTATGTVTLAVNDASDVNGPITVGGSAVSVSLPRPGQNANLSFTGSAGQQVSWSFSGNTVSCFYAAVQRADRTNLRVDQFCNKTTGLYDQVTLPADGTYYVRIDPNGTATGSLSVSLLDASDVNGPITVGGSAVSVSLPRPGQNANLSFTGSAGQQVAWSFSGNTLSCFYAAVQRADRTNLRADQFCNSTTGLYDQVTLPANGTYYVRIDPSGTATGTLDVRLLDASDVNGPITVEGSAVSVSLPRPGQNANLSFTGTAGQQVAWSFSGNTVSCFASSVQRADHSNLRVSTFCNSPTTGFYDQVTLPADGTYYVRIDPSGTATGSLSVSLLDASDVNGPITVGGSAVSVSLPRPGQNANLSFTGTAGQQVSWSFSGNTVSCFASSVQRADHSNLRVNTFCNSATGLYSQVTLPADGTYYVRIDPSGTATGSLDVRLYNGPPPAGIAQAAHVSTGVRAPLTGSGSTSAKPPPTTVAGQAKASPSPATVAGTVSPPTTVAGQPKASPRQPQPSTADQLKPDPQAVAEETWTPDALQLRGDTWVSRRPHSLWAKQSPLQAPKGVTALAGQTLTLNGQPLPGVTLRLESKSTKTKATGQFLLTGVPAGHHVLLIDGRSASTRGRRFGVFEVGVDIAAGKTTALPATIWMPRLDTTHTERFASPTTDKVVLTTQRIPGLEVHVPAGSTIRDTDGKVVRELGITPIPVDRPPFPLPAGTRVPIYFTVQPGGAYVFPEGARIIYPNYTHERPGTRVEFWNYDPKGKGWHVYGHGEVTRDGKQVVPDPGVRVYAFTGAMFGVPGPLAAVLAAFRDAWQVIDGDPVDLGTGLFVNTKTDLAVPDILPISITRTYRQADNAVRAFGIGTNFNYGIFLQSANQYQEVDLVSPDSSKIHYVRISPGTHWTDAVFEAQNTTTAFYKSTIVYNGRGWNLTLRDGTVYVFGDNAPLQAIRDRYGNQITLTRTSGQGGNITQITSPTGKWIKLSYDTSNRITQARDNIGRTVTYTYDAAGRLWKVTDPDNKTTTYGYNTSNQLTTITDPRNITFLTNEYDANGRVKTQTQADSSTYQFAYTTNAGGKVTETQVTDPRGHIRKVTFNADGAATSDTAALGTPQQQTTTLTRQPGTNFVTQVTDQLGRKTDLGYDAKGNVNQVTRLAGTTAAQTTTMVYDGPFSQVSMVTDPLDHKTSFSYDAKGNLTSLKDPLDRETTFTYNSAGQPASAKNSLDHTTRFTYELGDLATTEDPLGRTSRQFADAAGRLVSVTDPTGATSRTDYDARNQPTETTDPLGQKTSFTYDPNGNLLTVKDARDKVTTYTYDNRDRVNTLTDPLGKIQRYTYDANGNLATLTSRRNKTTSYSYDPLGRLTQVKYGVAGTSAESTVGYSWDAGNRLTQIDDSAAGSITYTPDNLDRITNEATPQGSVAYGYDAADRLTTMTVAGQPQVSYGYNNADQPTTITRGSQTVSVDYDAVGRPTTLKLPGGVSETYGLDAAGQLTSITYKQGTSTLGDLTYGYDPAGRTATVGGSFARVAIPDPFSSASYNANNQLTSRAGVSYSYDDDGNLTGDGTSTYSWNARGQLTGLSRTGLTASFAYDPVGRRSGKTINGTATGYLHDGANPAQELSGTTPTADLFSGGIDQTFTRTDNTGQRTFLTDALGSTVALTDSSGAVKTSYTYEPFGKTTATGETNANPSRYTGREDDGTGLYYYRARYYHPGLQRFISEDPAGFTSGDTNLYAYVGNNPTNLTDPSGENPAAGAVATCLTNAAISGGLSFLEQRLSGRKVNWGWGGVGGAAAIGCVGGLAAEALGWIVGRAIGRAFGGGADDLLSNGCRANSFTADTPVLMADGTTKPISEVEVGDWVLASDPESGQATPQRVKDVIVGEGQKRLVDVKVDGKILTATEGHPFYSVTEHRWVPAGDLEPGDRLRRADGHKALINSVREYGVAKARVFNLTVEGVHTFFAGKTKILVHNCAWSWHDGPRDYLVYLGLGDRSPLYVGKTSRINFRDRRWAHLADDEKPLLDDVRPFIENLTETEALVVETRLFERFRDFLIYNDRRSLKLSAEQRQWADDFLQRTFGI